MNLKAQIFKKSLIMLLLSTSGLCANNKGAEEELTHSDEVLSKYGHEQKAKSDPNSKVSEPESEPEAQPNEPKSEPTMQPKEPEPEPTDSKSEVTKPKKPNEADQITVAVGGGGGGKNIIVLKPGVITFDAGKSYGIVGKTGCGKSTLVNLLLGIFDMPNGKVILDGQRIDEVSLQSLRKAQAVCPQHPTSFKERTILENICYGCEGATDEMMLKAVQLADFEEVVEKLPNKYQTRLGPDGRSLSGGQNQRLAISRLLLKMMCGGVALAVCDEMTSALDVDTEKKVMGNVYRIAKKQGITILVIAHRLSTIKNCDEILLIDNGEVAERGTHKELLKLKGRYYNYWKTLTDTEEATLYEVPELEKLLSSDKILFISGNEEIGSCSGASLDNLKSSCREYCRASLAAPVDQPITASRLPINSKK